MLDSVSLPTPAAATPPDTRLLRAECPCEQPVSAFTSFVDALTGQNGGTPHADRGAASNRGDAQDSDRDDRDETDPAETAIVAAEASLPKAIADAIALARRNTGLTPGDAAAKQQVTGTMDAAARARAAVAAAAVAAALESAGTAGAEDAAGDTFDSTALAGRPTSLAAALVAELARGEHASADAGSSGDAQGEHADTNTGASNAPLSRQAIALAALRLAGEGEPASSRASQLVDAALGAGAGSTSASAHAEAIAARVMALPVLPTGATLANPTLAHTLASATLPAGASLDLPTSETGLQIVQAMRLQWSGGVSEAHINLEPNHFGDVSISLRVEQGQVTARVQAEAPIVREWLQTNQTWLRQSLAEQGLTLGRLDITEPAAESSHEDRRESSRDGRDETPAKRSRRPLPGEVFEVIA